MPKITEQMTSAAYEAALRVISGQSEKSTEIEKLQTEYGMAPGSAQDYIYNIDRMLAGKVFRRTFNNPATEYILSKIRTDFGVTIYALAIRSVELHTEYYASLGHGHLRGIESIAARHRSNLENIASTETVFPDEVADEENLLEGAVKQVFVNAYERNMKARKACIEIYGLSCSVCGINFEKQYGEIGVGFIHVHHLLPISSIGKDYKIDPKRDLRPVCPNCHAMLHKRNPPLSIEELKSYITSDCGVS